MNDINKRSPNNAINSPEYQEFLGILQHNKRRIFGFILAAVPQYSTAEDIMQDTIIRLWSKFSTYTYGTNFSAWGISCARYVIMEYRKKNRSAFVQFDSLAMDNLSESFEKDDHADNRVEALRNCLKKLPDIHQRIIRMRYSENLTVKEIALKIGRPIHGMYKAVVKIQNSLQECIEGVLRKWDMV